MFSPDFILKQKKRLEKEKKELERLLSEFAVLEKRSSDDWKTDFPDISPNETDPEDMVDEVEEYVDLLPQEYALEVKLKNVNEALLKIKKGTYGFCENYKKQISKKRLEVNPSSKKCEDCLV